MGVAFLPSLGQPILSPESRNMEVPVHPGQVLELTAAMYGYGWNGHGHPLGAVPEKTLLQRKRKNEADVERNNNQMPSGPSKTESNI